MKQLRMILGFLIMVMGLTVLGCPNPAASAAAVDPVVPVIPGGHTGPVAMPLPDAQLEELLVVGDSYGGGKVAYILQAGDPGYSTTDQHGLIVAAADQGTIVWAQDTYNEVLVGTGTAIGTGSANTNAIIAQNGAGTGYAAGMARACTDGGYSDWFLPSKDELNKLCLNGAAIGGIGSSSWYWSSSEHPDNGAWVQGFDDGSLGVDNYGKNYCFYIRAVRTF